MRSTSGAADVYDSRTIALHWVTALLVLTLWAIGECIDFFPKGAPRIGARSVHITLGALLAVMLTARIVWRLRAGVRLPPANPRISPRLAVGVHYLLYALSAIVVLVGIACVWFRGDTLFNLFTVPAFDPNDRKLAQEAVHLHSFAVNVLLAVAGLHAAAALFHQCVLGDRVLRRMWPDRSRAHAERRFCGCCTAPYHGRGSERA